MLTIRLQRTGSKNRPSFRLVLAEAHRSASKRFLEVLGHYNPRSKEFGIKDEERLKYWLGQNVQLSPTVHNLLVTKKFVDAKKVQAWKAKKSAEGGSASGGKPQAEGAAAAPSAAEAAPAAPAAETPAEAPKESTEAAA
jgi:small subunit ribosomal protein S16